MVYEVQKLELTPELSAFDTFVPQRGKANTLIIPIHAFPERTRG